MRVNALPSTGKSSKQTQQGSLLAVGGLSGVGLELRLSPCPMEELDAVDVVSVALSVASLGSSGFEEPARESITGNGPCSAGLSGCRGWNNTSKPNVFCWHNHCLET